MLELWKSDLKRTNTIAAGKAYIECNLGQYDNRSVSIALQLHKAIAIAKAIEKEIDWFQLNRLVPRNISCAPDPIVLNAYKLYIHNNPNNSILQTFDMFPDELARLCGGRYLSSNHICYFPILLNTANSSSVTFYGNLTHNILQQVQRATANRDCTPSRQFFLLNIGKDSLGNVFIGNDRNHGCHFSMMWFDVNTNTLWYGDSLGWDIPNNMENHVLLFIKEAFPNFSNTPLVLRPYHSNEGIEGPHLCNERFWRYPLQKDGSSCGVIALIMVAIAVIEPDHFRDNISINTEEEVHYHFLWNPSKYRR